MYDDLEIDANLVIDALRTHNAELAYQLAIAQAAVAQLRRDLADTRNTQESAHD